MVRVSDTLCLALDLHYDILTLRFSLNYDI